MISRLIEVSKIVYLPLFYWFESLVNRLLAEYML